MRTLALAVWLSLLLAPSAVGAAGDVPVAVWGAGTRSCGYWNENRQNKVVFFQLKQWVLGYVSAYNFANEKRQFEAPDEEGIVASIDRICANSPRATIAGAAVLLTEEFPAQTKGR